MAAKPEGIAISDLDAGQLSGLQRQLDQEISFFANSGATLKSFADKVAQSAKSLESLENTPPAHEALIPLSDSMYIRAKLSDPSKTLVEIGTGYYAEMSREKAMEFFLRKTEMIVEQLKTIEKILMEKKVARSAVVDSLQSKIQQQMANMPSPSALPAAK